MMSRIFTESGELREQVFQKHLAHISARFIPAFERALPGVPRVELFWRMLFMMGAVAHTIGGASGMLRMLSGAECDPTDIEGIYRRVRAFLLAALQAPVGVEVEHAVH